MSLTREEIEEFKRQYLEKLELDEARRAEEEKRSRLARIAREETLDPKAIELEREAQLEQLKEQVEAQFYKKRGHKRYVDHRGNVLWLSPEEHAYRIARRRRNEANTGSNVLRRRRLQMIGIYIAVALCALAAGMFLTR